MGDQRSGVRSTLFPAAVLLTAASLLNLLINLLIQITIAAYFGVGPEMDAYKAAMALPQWLQLFLGVVMTFVLVPFFVGAFREGKEGEPGWRAASALVNWLLLGTGAAEVAALLAGGGIVTVVAPGLVGQTHLLARRLLLISLPAGVLLLLQAVLVSICHARFRFLLPTAATFLNGLLTLGLLTVLSRTWGIAALPAANAAGTTLALIVILRALFGGGKGRRYHLTLSAGGTGLGGAVLAALPLVLTAPLWQSDPLVSTRVASRMGVGVLSYLRYTQNLLTALFQATATGLAAAIFPFLSQAADRADRELLLVRLRTGVGAMMYLSLPLAALTLSLAHPTIEGLFVQPGGRFTTEDVKPVGDLLLCYLPAYLAMCIGTVTSNTIFALRRTVEASALFSLAFGAFILGLVVLVGRFGYYGIGLASSLHFWVRLGLSWLLLRWRLGRLGGVRLLGWAARYFLCAAAAGAVAGGVKQAADHLLNPQGRWELLAVAGAGLAGGGVYLLLTLLVLRTPVGDTLRERLARRGRSSNVSGAAPE